MAVAVAIGIAGATQLRWEYVQLLREALESGNGPMGIKELYIAP
jgi:hypothetical protein